MLRLAGHQYLIGSLPLLLIPLDRLVHFQNFLDCLSQQGRLDPLFAHIPEYLLWNIEPPLPRSNERLILLARVWKHSLYVSAMGSGFFGAAHRIVTGEHRGTLCLKHDRLPLAGLSLLTALSS